MARLACAKAHGRPLPGLCVGNSPGLCADADPLPSSLVPLTELPPGEGAALVDRDDPVLFYRQFGLIPGAGWHYWKPGVNEAICHSGGWGCKRAPTRGCGCGYYASHHLCWSTANCDLGHLPATFGLVRAWGVVMSTGSATWRFQFGELVAVSVIKHQRDPTGAVNSVLGLERPPPDKAWHQFAARYGVPLVGRDELRDVADELRTRPGTAHVGVWRGDADESLEGRGLANRAKA